MDEYDDDELIKIIEDYADNHPKWDREFIDDVKDDYEEYGSLTDGQRQACENIATRYRMVER